jgi:hypothetical protein
MYNISIRMGLFMLLSFIAFFLLMYTWGLGYRSELRLFNVVIQLFFMYLSINAYYKIDPKHKENYLLGVAQGIRTSAIGILGFIVFMIGFMLKETKFMETIRQNSSMGEYLNPFTANLYLLCEGMIVGLIGSYIMTRIWGVDMNKD